MIIVCRKEFFQLPCLLCSLPLVGSSVRSYLDLGWISCLSFLHRRVSVPLRCCPSRPVLSVSGVRRYRRFCCTLRLRCLIDPSFSQRKTKNLPHRSDRGLHLLSDSTAPHRTAHVPADHCRPRRLHRPRRPATSTVKCHWYLTKTARAERKPSIL